MSVTSSGGSWRRWFHWRKDEDPGHPRPSLSPAAGRPGLPSVSSPFNVRRRFHLDVNLQWHGTGAELSEMLELVGPRIGRGGFSDVYLARLKETQGWYACKVFRNMPYGGGEEDNGGAQHAISSLIRREMDALRTLRHDHLVSYFGCLASPASHHLALLMELCDGGSVKDLLVQSTEPLKERHIAHILRCTLLALQYLHSMQLVHRDVKGANILLTTAGQVRLGDLGISAQSRRHHTPTQADPAPFSASSYSHPLSSTSSSSSSSSSASPQSATNASAGGSPEVDVSASPTSTSTFSPSESPFFSASPNSAATPSSSSPYPSIPLSHPSQPMGGTPLFMSPECLAGAEPDSSGDVWALGITAIEMAARHPPHTDLTSLEEIRAVVRSSPSPSLTHHAPAYPASPDFHSFVDACLHKDPQQRATVSELLAHPFITQCTDPAPVPAAATPNGLHPPSGFHLGVPVSPRGSLSPVTPPSSDGPDGCMPPPMLQPRRSVSCPSPRTPLSPRPSSSSLTPPADAEFSYFIIYGRYPVADADATLALQPFDERSTSPLPHPPPSAQRRFSTSSPAPTSPAVPGIPALMDKLARRGSGRRPSVQAAEATPPALALLPLRTSRQLSVPSPRAMPSSSLSSSQSLSPASSLRSPSRTPLAPSPVPFTDRTGREDHPPPTLRLPPAIGSFRFRKSQQGGGGRMRSEHKEATPSPRTDSEDGDTTPATPFSVALNDEPAIQTTHLRRAVSLDYGTSRDVQVMARGAMQPLSFQRRWSLREMVGEEGGRAPEGVVISLDITPRQGGGERSGTAGSGEENADTPTYLPLGSISPLSSPSPADAHLPHSSSSTLPPLPRPSSIFSFPPSTLPSHDDEGEEEVDDADAAVVHDLDDAFADLTKLTSHAFDLSAPHQKEEMKAGGGGGGGGGWGSKAPPPLIALSSVTATSGSSVEQLRHHIDLTPSPSPRPWDEEKVGGGKEEAGGRRKANSLHADRRDGVAPHSHPRLSVSPPTCSYPPLSLHSAASSPQLLSGLHSAESVGQGRLTFDASTMSGPHPSPSTSASLSPSSSSPSSRLAPSSSLFSRRLTISLALPNIIDNEPNSRSPVSSRAAPLSSRASLSRPTLSFLPPSPCPSSPLPPPSHDDSYIISEHGTLITAEFRISAAGLITSPDGPPSRSLGGIEGGGGLALTPRAISPCPSPSLPLTPRAGERGLHIPTHSRSFSTPMALMRVALDELRAPSPAASPPSHGRLPAADSPSPRRPEPLRRLSSKDAAAPLRACLRAEDLVEMGDIGSGQHGSVRKALHLPSLTLVALKTMNVYDRDARHQLCHELKTFSKLNSDHLVSFLGAYHRDGQIIMGSEYMDCGSLLGFVQQNAQPLTPLPSAVTSAPTSPTPLVGLPSPVLRHIARQVVLGLEYLHRAHLVHRDVKPDNVLINHSYTARIGDFGLTAQLDHSQASISVFSGTLAYLSPERVGKEHHSFPADIWSLGMTIAHAAATVRGQEHGGFDIWQIWRKKTEVEQLKAAAPADDACHRTFPHLPSFRTAFIPSEISEVYHDEHLRSFLAACLQIAPQQRWTATQLLQHPFIQRGPASVGAGMVESAELIEQFGLPAGFERSSLEDLNHVCAILCESYPLCTAGHAVDEECGAECQLQLDVGRVQCLAQQFGKSEEEVRQAFAKARRAHRSRA